jgi:hypothetical protein
MTKRYADLKPKDLERAVRALDHALNAVDTQMDTRASAGSDAPTPAATNSLKMK